MKMIITLLVLMTCYKAFSQDFLDLSRRGSESGGGGDAKTERRIKDIRDDILDWINNEGAANLKFSEKITYDDYLNGSSEKNIYSMLEILKPGTVSVSAFSKEEEDRSQPLLNTYVSGAPKVCRGFVLDKTAYLVCSKEKFGDLTEAEQYQQIHHEYASLARLEQNYESDSDYSLSKQITSFLEEQTVLKLAVKKIQKPELVNYNSCKVFFEKKDPYEYRGSVGEIYTIFDKKYPRVVRAELFKLERVIERRGFYAVSNRKKADWIVSMDYFYYKVTSVGDTGNIRLDKRFFDTLFTLKHESTGYFKPIEASQNPNYREKKKDIVTYNKRIKAKIKQARQISVAETAKWQSQLLPMEYNDFDEKKLSDSIFENFPKCSDVLGKK